MSSHNIYKRGISPVEVDPKSLIDVIFVDSDKMSRMNATTVTHILTALNMVIREKDERIDAIITKYGPIGLDNMSQEETDFSTKFFALKRDLNQFLTNLCNDLLSYKLKGQDTKDLLSQATHILLELYDRTTALKIGQITD